MDARKDIWLRATLEGRYIYVNTETATAYYNPPQGFEHTDDARKSATDISFADDRNSMNGNASFSDNHSYSAHEATVDDTTTERSYSQADQINTSGDVPSIATPIATVIASTPVATQKRSGYVRVDTLNGWYLMYSFDHRKMYFNKCSDLSVTLWDRPAELPEYTVKTIENRFFAKIYAEDQAQQFQKQHPQQPSQLVIVPEANTTSGKGDDDTEPDEDVETKEDYDHNNVLDNMPETPCSTIIHSPGSHQGTHRNLTNYAEEDDDVSNASASVAAATIQFQYHGILPKTTLQNSLNLDIDVGNSANSTPVSGTPSNHLQNHNIPPVLVTSPTSIPPPFPSTLSSPAPRSVTSPPPFNPNNFPQTPSNSASVSASVPRPPSLPPSNRDSFSYNSHHSNSASDSMYAGTPSASRQPPLRSSINGQPSGMYSNSRTNSLSDAATSSPVPPNGPRPPSVARTSIAGTGTLSANSTLRLSRTSSNILPEFSSPMSPNPGTPISTIQGHSYSAHGSHTTTTNTPTQISQQSQSGPLSRAHVADILNQRLRESISMTMPPPSISSIPAGPPIAGKATPTQPTSPRTLADEISNIKKMDHITYSGPCEKRTTGITRRVLVPRYLRIENSILTHWTSFMEVTVADGKSRGYMSVAGSVIHIAPASTGIDPTRGFEIWGLRGKDRVLYQVQFVHPDECEAWIYALVRNGAADCRHPILANDLYYGKNRKLLHALLYHDRIELYNSPNDVLPTNNSPPVTILSFTRGSSITPNTSESNAIYLDVVESPIRDIRSASHTIGFQDIETMQSWGMQILKSIRGPLGVVFGGEISHLTSISPYVVPEVIHLCIQRLLSVGLHEEGLLRVPGSDMQISEIKNMFNTHNHTVSTMLKDPNTVAGVFKVFFRELMDSVIPMQKYELFTALDCRTGSDSVIAGKAIKLKSYIEQLPIDNQYCLNYVIHLLVQISSKHTTNKMNPKNCAMVLAPGLLRSQIANDNDLRSFSKMSEQEAVVELMILHYNTIFPRGPPYVLSNNAPTKASTENLKRGSVLGKKAPGPPPAGPPPESRMKATISEV